MTRTLLHFITILVLLLLTGCDSNRKQSDARRDATEDELTTEIAKRCLLEMEPGQIPPGVIIPPPKDEPIRIINADEMELGVWECNLKKKTFHASAHFPEAIHHKTNHVRGVFERTPDGKWVAKVTGSKSGG